MSKEILVADWLIHFAYRPSLQSLSIQQDSTILRARGLGTTNPQTFDIYNATRLFN